MKNLSYLPVRSEMMPKSFLSIAPVLAEITGWNPVEALIFFQASSFLLLKLENLLR